MAAEQAANSEVRTDCVLGQTNSVCVQLGVQVVALSTEVGLLRLSSDSMLKELCERDAKDHTDNPPASIKYNHAPPPEIATANAEWYYHTAFEAMEVVGGATLLFSDTSVAFHSAKKNISSAHQSPVTLR